MKRFFLGLLILAGITSSSQSASGMSTRQVELLNLYRDQNANINQKQKAAYFQELRQLNAGNNIKACCIRFRKAIKAATVALTTIGAGVLAYGLCKNAHGTVTPKALSLQNCPTFDQLDKLDLSQNYPNFDQLDLSQNCINGENQVVSLNDAKLAYLDAKLAYLNDYEKSRINKISATGAELGLKAEQCAINAIDADAKLADLGAKHGLKTEQCAIDAIDAIDAIQKCLEPAIEFAHKNGLTKLEADLGIKKAKLNDARMIKELSLKAELCQKEISTQPTSEIEVCLKELPTGIEFAQQHNSIELTNQLNSLKQTLAQELSARDEVIRLAEVAKQQKLAEFTKQQQEKLFTQVKTCIDGIGNPFINYNVRNKIGNCALDSLKPAEQMGWNETEQQIKDYVRPIFNAAPSFAIPKKNFDKWLASSKE